MRTLSKYLASISTAAVLLFALPVAAEDKTEETFEPSAYWLSSIGDQDRKAIGYVAEVEPPYFTLRTHEDGMMSFILPETTEEAKPLQTGDRVQVWFDKADKMTDTEGADFLVVHGLGFPAIVADTHSAAADHAKDSMKKSAAMSDETVLTDDPAAVQNTALPPTGKAGPGAIARVLTGTVVAVDDSSLTLDTVVGRKVVRIVEQTQMLTQPEPGDEIAIEFHRGTAVIHAAAIKALEATSTR